MDVGKTTANFIQTYPCVVWDLAKMPSPERKDQTECI